MAKIEYGRIIEVENGDLKKLNRNPKKFWKNVKFLGEGAFKNCSELKEILIPKTVEMSYENPFEGCENLERIFVEDGNEGLSTDGRSLFYVDGKFLVSYANASGEIYLIPKGVVAISSSAFKDCKNLKKVNISKTVESIGWGAFENSGLTEILIPKTVKTVDCDAFKNCPNLQEIKVETDNIILKVETQLFNELLEEESDMKKVASKIKVGKQIAETLLKYQPAKATTSEREKFEQKMKELLGKNSKTFGQIKTEEQVKEIFQKYKTVEVAKEPSEREKTLRRILNVVKGHQDDQNK